VTVGDDVLVKVFQKRILEKVRLRLVLVEVVEAG
jgi:hypothetical protein